MPQSCIYICLPNQSNWLQLGSIISSKCESGEQKVLRLSKQNEVLHQRLHQRDKKILNMDLLQLLKDKQLILDEQLQNLNQNLGHVAQSLFENYAKNVKKVILIEVVIAQKQNSL